jgi:hypothetical protein
MARETLKAKRARVADLLAAYDEQSRALRKLEKDVKALAEQVRELEPGTYNDWSYAEGTPREILDQPAARKLIMELGGLPPVTTTRPPIVVAHIAATGK